MKPINNNTRKLICLSTTAILLLVSLFSVSLFAGEPPVVSIGGRVGLGLSGFWGKDAGDLEKSGLAVTPRTGLVVGPFLNLDFSKILGLQVSLLYSQKGRNYSGNRIEEPSLPPVHFGDNSTQLDYFETQILAKLSAGTDKVRGYIGVGPDIGVLLMAQSVTDVTVPSELQALGYESSHGTSSMTGDVTSIDAGVCFGLGGSVRAGPGYFFLDGRYVLGFMSVYAPGLNGSETVEKYNWQVLFNVGYGIILGKNR